jgi:hypothetical protein
LNETIDVILSTTNTTGSGDDLGLLPHVDGNIHDKQQLRNIKKIINDKDDDSTAKSLASQLLLALN